MIVYSPARCRTRLSDTIRDNVSGHRRCLPRMAVFLLPLVLLPLAAAVQPVAAGASSAAGDSRLQQAVVWSQQQMYGQRRWIEDGETLCGTFVENAYYYSDS